MLTLRWCFYAAEALHYHTQVRYHALGVFGGNSVSVTSLEMEGFVELLLVLVVFERRLDLFAILCFSYVIAD